MSWTGFKKAANRGVTSVMMKTGMSLITDHGALFGGAMVVCPYGANIDWDLQDMWRRQTIETTKWRSGTNDNGACMLQSG
ncbi:MAG: hypothetical protein MMC23_008807 [Stictis urceolatum]|nr:hypothetical protein [Stictis urceolata]